MRNIRTVAFVLLAVTTSSCSEEMASSGVKVSLKPSSRGNAYISIQAINDKVTVRGNVVVNRWNCLVSSLPSINGTKEVTIRFGETFDLNVIDCEFDNIKEVEVTTNSGTFVFTFS